MDFQKIEKKWQKRWEDKKIFKVTENSKKKKFYCLEMFPYPSGSGLHMGHSRNYCIGDVYARYKRMNGINVLYPMGYDALGLPAENAAIQAKAHPKPYTEKCVKNFIRQQKELGLSYDWDRLVVTMDPEYYKWNQWFFLKLYERGLAYKSKAPANWCDSCGTVLANEQVKDGKCWRCYNEVQIKPIEQWLLKITDYAEELLEDIEKLQWPEKIKIMQRNWIGKSEGTLVEFPFKDSKETIPIFTTRPDTLYGVTFMVYAPEHPKVLELVKGTKYEKKVKAFIKKVVIQDKFSRAAEDKDKEGMFIGKYAINPLTNEEIPIYIANFVLLEYGTGAIMAVPTHDQRDFEFAKKYKIPMKVVITPRDHILNPEKMVRAYLGDGVLINSGEFDGEGNREAIPNINKYLEKKKIGKKTTQYKIRDWLISRQRYWGTPIPIIYCKKCGVVPVPEKDLPVILPEKAKFTGKGNPLENVKSFVNAKCPKCKGKAKRETDTMDTFVDSSWYFLRYCSPKEKDMPFDKNKVKYWMPVDQYIGGAEHAVMHLIYARFFTKVLRDLKLLNFDEPFTKLFNQGMLHKDGVVMSKSKGNIVLPEEISKRYGIDSARFFLLFIASPDKDMEWEDKGIVGVYKLLNKFYRIFDETKIVNKKIKKQESKIHRLIKDVTENIENFKYNIALIKISSFINYLSTQEEISKGVLERVLLIMSPFTPHICEELWEKIGNKPFVSIQKWPKYDETRIDAKTGRMEELIKQTSADIVEIQSLIKKEPREINIFVSPKWKYEAIKIAIKNKDNINKIIPEIMKIKEAKQHEKIAAQFAQSLIKNIHQIQEPLKQYEEFKALKEAQELFKEEFKCKVNIIKDDKGKSNKALKAEPRKPGIEII